MDRQLAERMVGAAVLLTVLVLVVPLILDGGDDESREPSSPAAAPLDLRTHTIHLDREARELPVPRPLAPPDSPAGSSSSDPPSTDLPAARPADPDPSAGGEAAPPAAPSTDPQERAGPDRLAADPPPKVEAPRTAAPVPAPRPAAAPAPAVPKPPVAAATATDGGWVVQLGSFSKRPNAERLASEARAKGFQVSVLSTSVAGGTHYRVRTGVVAERDTAQTLAGRLAAAGYPNQVMRP